MSYNIPFEIQSEIMKRLPVKSLIQFRSVCKSWKSLIHSSDFISHHISQQNHLFVRYKDAVNFNEKYVSIVDDDVTFPLQKVSVTIPPLVVDMLTNCKIINSFNGLLCLYDDERAVIWNPSITKAVDVVLPNLVDNEIYGTVLGFGVCGEINDIKIVKINYLKNFNDVENLVYIPFQVEVFTLSTGAWRSLSGNSNSNSNSNLPRKSVEFGCDQVVVDGCIYWLAHDRFFLDEGDTYRTDALIVSFDMTSEECGEVNLPDCLALDDRKLSINKMRESLVVIDDGYEDYKVVYNVWMMEDGVPKSFMKLYTIGIESPYVGIVRVCGFRKTGEALIELQNRHGLTKTLAAYERYSKSVNDVKLKGSHCSFSVYSYMETLLLL